MVQIETLYLYRAFSSRQYILFADAREWMRREKLVTNYLLQGLAGI